MPRRALQELSETKPGVILGDESLISPNESDIVKYQSGLESHLNTLGPFVFPLELYTPDYQGLYPSVLNFTVREDSRVQLQAAGLGQFYGHENSTATINKYILCDIVLPMPASLSVSYNQGYGTGEIGMMESLIAAQTAGSWYSGMLKAGTKAVAFAGGVLGYGNQAIFNRTENAKETLTYEKPELRSLTLDYAFNIRSQNDLRELNNIIETFKYYSAPYGQLNDEFIKIPQKWILEEISATNDKIIKPFAFGPAVITNFTIDTNNHHQFTSGDPILITISIMLKETFPVFKNDIAGLDSEGKKIIGNSGPWGGL